MSKPEIQSSEDDAPQNTKKLIEENPLYASLALELEEILPKSNSPNPQKLPKEADYQKILKETKKIPEKFLEDPSYVKILEQIAVREESDQLTKKPKSGIVPDPINVNEIKKIDAPTDQSVLSLLTHALQQLPFAGLEILGNFEGYCLVEITDDQGNIISLANLDQIDYCLSDSQVYQLRITIQAKEPLRGIFDTIRLTDGENIEFVTFTLNLICDSLKFEPDEIKLTSRAKQPETTTKIIDFIPTRGVHHLFVQISQNHTLVQVIILELKVQ